MMSLLRHFHRNLDIALHPVEWNIACIMTNTIGYPKSKGPGIASCQSGVVNQFAIVTPDRCVSLIVIWRRHAVAWACTFCRLGIFITTIPIFIELDFPLEPGLFDVCSATCRWGWTAAPYRHCLTCKHCHQ